MEESLTVGISPLRWWSERQLELFAIRFEEAMRAWCDAWGIAAPPAVACRRAHEWRFRLDVARAWWPLAQEGGDGAQVWLRTEPFIEERVFAALFGPRPAPALLPETPLLAEELARRAWAELREALRSACALPAANLGEPASSAPQPPARPWSGAIVALVSCGPLELTIEASARAAAAMMAAIAQPARAASKRPALAAPAFLEDALRAQRVRVKAELSRAEMDLGSLQALAVGDVIRLAHPLARPLTLHESASGAPLCAAHLGRIDGHRAVELTLARDPRSSEDDR